MSIRQYLIKIHFGQIKTLRFRTISYVHKISLVFCCLFLYASSVCEYTFSKGGGAKTIYLQVPNKLIHVLPMVSTNFKRCSKTLAVKKVYTNIILPNPNLVGTPANPKQCNAIQRKAFVYINLLKLLYRSLVSMNQVYCSSCLELAEKN